MRNPKFGRWHEGFVREPSEHIVKVSSREYQKGTSNKVAYEDLCLRPDNSLLRELDNIHFKCPRSYSIIDADMEPYLPDPDTNPNSEPNPAPDVPPPVHLDTSHLYPEAAKPAEALEKDNVEHMMEELPDLSLDFSADLAAAYLPGFAINSNLLDVPASSIKQSVSLITK